ncbi:hypothetical protein [Natrinema salaciae]|uniref:Uncharacterized protein n=1 Tax=Natrinema salaciae TaxID=1186196 RepID=A0A1H9ITR3_9EURY|nr:hypothetical protein [Natrinema salaciae]SEQ77964.1 hypothetical protein SAMN04489841_2330 [Natrinema salaciae]
MSTDSTVTEVFEDVEADPDAILEAWDAETPAELVESGGRHEADAVDEISDVTAAEVFADHGDQDVTNSPPRDGECEETRRTDEGGDDRDDASDRVADREFEFVGDAAVAVRDDDRVETASSGTLTLRDGRTDGLELVGPEPTTTRVTDDTFGSH